MYQGGQPGHFWPKLAGFFLVPAAASIAVKLAAPLVVKAKDTAAQQLQATMTLTAVCHALGAAGSWYASGHLFEDSIGTQAFFRGGMWNELFSTVFVPVAIVASKKLETATPATKAAVSGLDPKNNIANLISLLSGGVTDKLATPRVYTQLSAGR